MNNYRGIQYQISWSSGSAHYTIWFYSQIFRGEGNHGTVKTLIDRAHTISRRG
jgi:hypothetical protein